MAQYTTKVGVKVDIVKRVGYETLYDVFYPSGNTRGLTQEDVDNLLTPVSETPEEIQRNISMNIEQAFKKLNAFYAGAKQ